MDAKFSESEERDLTQAEKWLGLGLVVFLLIGGIWILNQMGRLVPRPDWLQLREHHMIEEKEGAFFQASAAYSAALEQQSQHEFAVAEARRLQEFRREEYRTSLDGGRDDPLLRQHYETALADLEAAEERLLITGNLARARQEELAAVQTPYQEAQRRLQLDYERLVGRYELWLLLLRAGYALPLFGLSLLAWRRVGRRGGAGTILATAFAAFAGLQTVILVGQYSWHLFRNHVQVAVSASGTLATAAAIVALRRHALSGRRVVQARLWQGRCPRCGFPAGVNAYCSHCGHALRATCQACGRPRVAAAPYCCHCGAEAPVAVSR